MPSEASLKVVDGLISFLPGFAVDFLGRKPRKKVRFTKKERLKMAEEVDRLAEVQKEIESYQTPPKTAVEYVARLDKVGELFAPLLGRVPKGTSFARSLRDSYRQTTAGIGRWSYFPRTNYRSVAGELDRLTSEAFAKKAPATDKLLNEFWSSPDGIVIMRTPYTIVIRRCVYLANAKRKLNRRLVERLIETYRELSGLYEKGIRMVVVIMETLEGNEVTYAEIVKRRLASNVNQVSKPYIWLTKDFDTIIRNSIAHVNYVVSYNSNAITFMDNRRSVTVSFREFFRRCRFLSSLVVALLLLYVFYLYWRWKAVSDHYDRMKEQKSEEGNASRQRN